MARASKTARRTTRAKSSTGKSKQGAAKRRAAASRARNRNDALSMLKADHERVTKLFRQFERAGDGSDGRRELAEQICRELEIHATLEEEIFYPAARDAIRKPDLVEEAQVEHDSAKRLIADIRTRGADDERFAATVKVLSEYVKHHVDEEENEMFPQAKRAKLDLEAIGTQIAARKAELQGESGGPAARGRSSSGRSITDRLVGGGMLRH